MKDSEIKEKLDRAIQSLLEKDCYLLEKNVSERAITHKLAEYLQLEFSDYNVDCEYNRNVNQEKIVGISQEELTSRLITKYKDRLEELEPDDLLSISTYPDIIVHCRGDNKHNLLIVEVKKQPGESDTLDILKLKGFTGNNNPYQFQLGCSVLIKTNKDKLDTFNLESPTLSWYKTGVELNSI